MYIDHIAMYTYQLEVIREFYMGYFGAESSPKYQNPENGFESYFLTFPDEHCGCRLEIMHKVSIPMTNNNPLTQATGFTHLAFKVGSKETVRQMTTEFRKKGVWIVGEPRETGDGCYESIVLDPDGNRIEIMA